MATKMVRVDSGTYKRLSLHAERRHASMGEVVALAVGELDRADFFDQLDAAYVRLGDDRSYRDELAELEGTIADGLAAHG